MAAHLTSHRMKITSGSSKKSEEKLFDILQSGHATDITSYQDMSEVRPDCRNDSGYTMLSVAAQKGNVNAAEFLIQVMCFLNTSASLFFFEFNTYQLNFQHSHSVNEPDFYGQTPLQYAAEFGNINMLKSLIKSGANLNWMDTNRDGLSALHLATLNGNVDVVQVLIEAGSDVNVKDINGVSVLHCAVANTHHDIVSQLLKARARVNLRGNNTGRTPLFVAAEIGDLFLVEELLRHGAKVNTKDEYGMSPLCAVCIQNNIEVALRLIQAGAKVNIQDNMGSLPIHYVARFGNLELMESLISKGSELNHLNKYQETPLHLAVRMEHVRATKLLVQNGCNVNEGEMNVSETALHVAVNCCTDIDTFSAILEILIEGGIMLDNSPYLSMETSLYHAINSDKTQFAVLLLQHGSNPNADCPFDITILQKACEKNVLELTETLLHCHIDWNREVWLDTDIYMSGINPKLLSGYAEHIPTVLLKNIDLYIRLLEIRRNPASLMDACRWCIREQLQNKYHVKLERIQLPSKLQDFVMMKML